MFRLLTKSYANVFVLLCVLVSHNTSLARFVSPEEASQEVVCNHEINIYKDGTHEWNETFRAKILNEQAIKEWNVTTISYRKHSQTLKILEASTTVNTKVFPVPLDSIEDRPVENIPPSSFQSLVGGFQNLRQIITRYSNVCIGSEVLRKTSHTITPSGMQHYSIVLNYGDNGFWKESIAKITSEIPLYLVVNDPQNVLKVENKHDEKLGLYYYTITLVKPFTSQLTNEPESAVHNQHTKTYVSISRYNSWHDLGNSMAKEYEDILSKSDLSDEFINAVNEAKKLKTEVDQINHVTSFIQDKIKDLGIPWIPTERGWCPRSLAEILNTKYGDSKDYAALTIAMLRKLGLQANFALVVKWGNLGHEEFSREIVSSAMFNHTIAYVIGEQGQIYWIDAANTRSMAGKMFYDISDRPALVLDRLHSKYIDIPPVDYRSNKRLRKIVYDYKGFNKEKNNAIVVEGSVKMLNENAMSFTNSQSCDECSSCEHQEAIENLLYDIFAEEVVNKSDRLKTVIPDLKSRVVKDLEFHFKYNSKNHFYVNNDIGILLASRYLDIPEDSVLDFFIDTPKSLETTYIVNVPINNASSLNAKVSSQWIDSSRKSYLDTDGRTIVFERHVVKKSYITKKDRESKEFKELVKNLSIYFHKPVLVIPHK